MASSVLELLIQARDEAAAVLEGVGQAGAKAGDLIEKHWLKASAVLGGAAGAIEGLARKQQDQRIKMEQLAIRTGQTTEEVNKFARELANVGFPLEDVTGLMELAARQGLEGKDAIAGYANFWDLVADATGGSAIALAEAGTGLRAMGIAAGEEGAALDAFGFITKNTTGSVDEFLAFVGKAAPELTDMGVSVNDAAAILGVLEAHGISGRKAISEFTSAAGSADGDLTKLLGTLGVTAEEFAGMQGKVEGSGKILDDFAGTVDASFPPLQKLQHELGEVLTSFQGPIKAAADFAPLLSGVAAAMPIVAMASKIHLIPMLIGMAAAGWAAIAPWLPLAAAIGAIAAIGFVIWKNWDTISAALKAIWGGIQDFAVDAFNSIVEVAKTAANLITLPYRIAFEGIRAVINTVTSAINDIPEISIPSWVPIFGGNSFSIPHIPEIPSLPSFEHGGVVGGPLGQAQLAIVHGGERVIPAGGGLNIGTLVIHASSEVEGRAAARGLFDELRRLELTGQIAQVTR